MSKPKHLTLIFNAVLGLSIILISNIAKGVEEVDPAEIDALFQEWAAPNSPGGAVGVFLRGEPLYLKAFGLAKLDTQNQNALSTRFNIASVSKTFTAYAVLLLEEQGQLSQEDNLGIYIPELGDLANSISIYQLLHHTSGLRNISTLLALAGISESDEAHRERLFQLIANQEALNHAPGEKAVYSNSNYFLLALIVERVSGQSFQEFTAENIFQPLGMNSTYFREGIDEDEPDIAWGHLISSDNSFEAVMPMHHAVGATGLVISMEDFALWEGNFWEPKVGTPKLISKLYEKGILNSGHAVPYAKGTGNSTFRGLQLHGMSGAETGFRSNHLQFPDSGLSIAIFANATYDTSNPGIQIAALYLETEFSAAQAALLTESKSFISSSAGDLQSVSGAYRGSNSTDIVYVIPDIQNGSLFVTDYGIQARPVNSTVFESPAFGDSSRLEFVLDDSVTNTLEIYQSNQLVFEGVALRAATGGLDYLQHYAGNYVSAEVSSSFQLVFTDGSLYRTREGSPTRLLTSQYHDLFEAEGGFGTMLFERDETGEISGFRISIAGVSNLLFRRQ